MLGVNDERRNATRRAIHIACTRRTVHCGMGIDNGLVRDTPRSGDKSAIDKIDVAPGIEVNDQVARPNGRATVLLRKPQMSPPELIAFLTFENQLRIRIVDMQRAGIASQKLPRNGQIVLRRTHCQWDDPLMRRALSTKLQ